MFSRDLISQWSLLSSVLIKTNTLHEVMQTGLLVIYLLRNEPALLYRLTGLQGCSQDPQLTQSVTEHKVLSGTFER